MLKHGIDRSYRPRTEIRSQQKLQSVKETSLKKRGKSSLKRGNTGEFHKAEDLQTRLKRGGGRLKA